MLIGGLAICAAYVMRYAKRVKQDPAFSVLAKQAAAHRKLFLKDNDQDQQIAKLTTTH